MMLRLIYNNHDTINIPHKYVKLFQHDNTVTYTSPDSPNKIECVKGIKIIIDKKIDSSNIRVLDYSGEPCPFEHNNKKISTILNERRDLAQIYQYHSAKALFTDWHVDSPIDINYYQENIKKDNHIIITIK